MSGRQGSHPREDGLQNEKLAKAERQIEARPYDTEAWSIIIREAQRSDINSARTWYERALIQFPNSGPYWKIYIEHEMKTRNYDRVEKLFKRCLVRVLHIDLWKTYLRYISETKKSHPQFREKLAQAYEFALDKIGMDLLSLPIWSDYITFLKNVKAVGNFAESQRISAVRKAYQKGVVTPMLGIDNLWREYTQYEQGINALIAKKMIEDRGREYMNARRVAKEYELVVKSLNRSAHSVPPTHSVEETQQLDLWKKYISWEKSNPMRTEDQSALSKRVMFAYEQCLLCMGHHPDIWYEAASFLEQTAKLVTEKGDSTTGKVFADEASSIFERAIYSLMSESLLIHFAYADFEESRMQNEKVHKIYTHILDQKDVDPTLVYIMYMRFAKRSDGIQKARAIFKMGREDKRTSYHLFVAAANFEYFCSKNAQVGVKIFELGLRKYGCHPEYVSAYIDFMHHVNEDNNTRVLFERVLTSGQLPKEKSFDIWNKFLNFESSLGDLSSIAKVEKRRSETIESFEKEINPTALLIDRYKFDDLLPVSPNLLRSIGYLKIAPMTNSGDSNDSRRALIGDSSVKQTQQKYPTPDFSQMLPFRPRNLAPPGAHPVPGGVFPPPPAACHLMTLLPPPESFDGPFVIMDKFMSHLANLDLGDGSIEQHNGDGERGLDPGTRLTLSLLQAPNRKRRRTSGAGSGDEDSSNAAANDVYRARRNQTKKTK